MDKTNSSLKWKAFRKKLLRLLKDAIRLYERRDRLEQEGYDRLKMRLHCRLEQFLKAEHKGKDAKKVDQEIGTS